MKKCTKCGFENRDDSHFCVKCGNSFLQNLQEQVQNIKKMPTQSGQPIIESNSKNVGKPKKRRKGVIIAVIILLVGMICFIGAMFLLGIWGRNLAPYEKPIENFIELNDEDKFLQAFPIRDADASYVKPFRDSFKENKKRRKVEVTSHFEIIEETHLDKQDLENPKEAGFTFSFVEKGVEYKWTDGYDIKCKIIQRNEYGGEIESEITFRICKWEGKWYIFFIKYGD